MAVDAGFRGLDGEVGGRMGEEDKPRFAGCLAGLADEFEGVIREDVGGVIVRLAGSDFRCGALREADVAGWVPLVFGPGEKTTISSPH